MSVIRQLSLLGADGSAPVPDDLAGLLVGVGEVTRSDAAAQISAIVDHPWRASVLVAECARRGLAATCVATIADHIAVRTAYSMLLTPLAQAWTDGAVKRVPRGFSIAVVYLTFAAAVTVVAIAIGAVVIDQSREAADRISDYLTVERGQPAQTDAERDVDRLQAWLDDHGLERIQIEESVQKDPRHAEACYYLGLIRDERGDVRGATQAFLKSREMDLEMGMPPWAPGRDGFQAIAERVNADGNVTDTP